MLCGTTAARLLYRLLELFPKPFELLGPVDFQLKYIGFVYLFVCEIVSPGLTSAKVFRLLPSFFGVPPLRRK